MNAKRKRASLWIVGAWQDLGLLVLAPLWAIPLLWIAKTRFDPNGFGAALLAIGATGHHLPGFIRAYTDPVLFRQFRTRLIAAPLFLLAVYVLFFALHLQSLKLILILWGTWHGAMQVNGFLRIYDAKAGSFSTATSWLDRAMCLAWFGGGLLYSARLIALFSQFFNAGSGRIAPETFAAVRHTWLLILVGVTAAFLINAWRQAQSGVAPSPVKLLMMASSFGLWWFAMVWVDSILVGLLLFEIIHDVQYNTIVWVYSERRVSHGMTESPVEKFLFRPSATRALFYLALIFIYGALADAVDYANIQAPNTLQVGVSVMSFWTGLFMVSTFLHFYFDGFIWQVRDSGFRKGMGIEDNGATATQRRPNPGLNRWMPAGWKWAFFLVPSAVLGFSEYRTARMPLLDQARNVAELLPEHWQANAIAGSLEKASAEDGAALDHLQRAVALNPSYGYGETMLADLYARRGEFGLAEQHYGQALSLNTRDYSAQARLGTMLVNQGRRAEAIPHLLIAAEHLPGDPDLAYVLGASLVEANKELEGIPHLLRAVQLNPQHKEAFNYLGIAVQTQGDIRAAADDYRKALAIDPQYLAARNNLEQAHRLLASPGNE